MSLQKSLNKTFTNNFRINLGGSSCWETVAFFLYTEMNWDRDYTVFVESPCIHDIEETSQKTQVLKITEEDFGYPTLAYELLVLPK